MLYGRQPHQDVKVFDVLWTDCVPNFKLGRTKTCNNLKMGTQSVPEMSDNLHILTLLSAMDVTFSLLNFFFQLMNYII